MNVWYCSVKCQGEDWKLRHRQDCKDYCKWVDTLEKNIQTYRIKAPIEWNKRNQSNFNQNTKKESIAILEDSERMLSLFNPENIRAVISDKSIEGHGRIKELLSILSFIPTIKRFKYPQLILIDELIKAAQMQDNVAISRISDNGITTKGISH